MIGDDFQDPCPTETFERLCAGVLFAYLRLIQRKSHRILNRIGECSEILVAQRDPAYGFDGVIGHDQIMVEKP